jgi:glycosyltransferase involved in cell wall biosynthesis
MINGLKVVVVLPAYNAAKTLLKTYNEVDRSVVDELILVDDASHDDTAEVARNLGIKTIVHTTNLGYGGNQKTCYREALKAGADIVKFQTFKAKNLVTESAKMADYQKNKQWGKI